MAENKDFLKSLAQETEKKPASFQEEKVEKVDIKSPFRPQTIIITLIALALIGGAVYFFFFRPSITMENFVGSDKSEFSAWAKQNDISSTGIVYTEVYDFDYDEDVIISQSIDEGEKITKDAKITFVISMGADPDESIAFPDIMSMTYSDITAWIKDNKLSNTKVTTTYDDTVAENAVISYDLKNIDESAFTRGSTLSIVVSKGVKPASTVTVSTDYVDTAYTTFKSWADDNRLEVTMSEQYSSTIDKGNIISLSVAKGDKVKEGDTITVVVSKGPAVKMISFDKYTEQRVTDWCTANGVTVRFVEVYDKDNAEGIVSYQTIQPNTILSDDDILYVGISLGKPQLTDYVDTSVASLQAKIDDMNDNGAKLSINSSYTYQISESVAAGNIVSISNINDLTVGTKLNLVVSLGKNIRLYGTSYNPDAATLTWDNIVIGTTDEDAIRKLATANGVTYNVTYASDATAAIGSVLSVKLNDTSSAPVGGSYITQADTINIVICDSND